MGLLHTKQYMDFEPEVWKQISKIPIFESLTDKAVLEILDTSTKSHRFTFRKGAKIKVLRTVGKYRISWNDEDVL